VNTIGESSYDGGRPVRIRDNSPQRRGYISWGDCEYTVDEFKKLLFKDKKL
jgi:hypothetical protein